MISQQEFSRNVVRAMTAIVVMAVAGMGAVTNYVHGQEVVAYWGFLEEYEFEETLTKLDFAADVDATATGDANLQVFLGDPENLDHNGGSGFAYTSPISGEFFEETRTAKWNDLRGGGDDFDIDGVVDFMVDKGDGAGVVEDAFGNDGLLYITLNGSGWQDFTVSFDIEGTPGSLPTSFDIFYRVGGSDQWFRDPSQNNIELVYSDYDPVDPENQFAASGLIPLPAAIDNQAAIELLLTDFGENGNEEMEIDNVELAATRVAVPEPAAGLMLVIAALLAAAVRRKA